MSQETNVAPDPSGESERPSTEGLAVLSTRTYTATSDPRIQVDNTGQRCMDIRVIKTLPGRGRKEYHNLLQLAESISALGLVSPIKLRREGDDYYLVAGERRLRAFLLTGHRYIPFTVEGESDLWAKLAELAENTEREGMSWGERATVILQIHELRIGVHGQAPAGRANANPEGWSVAKTSAVVSKSEKDTRQHLKMAKLMKSRPDVAMRVMHMPLSRAIKEADKIQQTETFMSGHANGTITISADVQNIGCLDGIVALDNASIDLVVTDPPFGNSAIKVQTGQGSGSMSFTSVIKENDNLTPEKMRPLLEETIRRLVPKLKPGAHLYMFFAMEHYTFLIALLRQHEFIVDDEPIIWDKGRSVIAAMGYNWPSSYEPILFGIYKEKSRTLTEPSRNIITCSTVPIDQRLHMFQKPEKLLTELIMRSSKPGDLVLDPFCGSGAVVKTAKALNRNAKGFEIDKENYEHALRNLNQGVK